MQTRFVAIIVIVAIAATTAFYFVTVYQTPTEETRGIVEIEMTTKKWRWDPKIISGIEARASSSPSTGVFADTRIWVKTGDTVIIHLKNLDSDTAHGIRIVEFGVDAFVPPGETITIRFVADKAGTFTFACNVFCGVGHPSHLGALIVES